MWAGGLCVCVGVCSVVWVVAAGVLWFWGVSGCGWLFENSIVCCLFFLVVVAGFLLVIVIGFLVDCRACLWVWWLAVFWLIAAFH